MSGDAYRAACSPPAGCRQCGDPPVKPKRFYCSDACKRTFDADHFWGTARLVAQYPGGLDALYARCLQESGERALAGAS